MNLDRHYNRWVIIRYGDNHIVEGILLKNDVTIECSNVVNCICVPKSKIVRFILNHVPTENNDDCNGFTRFSLVENTFEVIKTLPEHYTLINKIKYNL